MLLLPQVMAQLGWRESMLNWSCLAWDVAIAHLAAADGACDIGVFGANVDTAYIDQGIVFTWPTFRQAGWGQGRGGGRRRAVSVAREKACMRSARGGQKQGALCQGLQRPTPARLRPPAPVLALQERAEGARAHS